MHDHLRFSGQSYDNQRAALEMMVRAEPLLMDVLAGLRTEALPDAWLVSGAIYNTVWNVLTGRRPMTGINDLDVAYFDRFDLSYEAEDRVIRAIVAPFGLEALFAFRVEPNHAVDNRPTHEAKAARAKAIWPELTIEPW